MPIPLGKCRTKSMRDVFKTFKNPKNRAAIHDAASWKFLRTPPIRIALFLTQLLIYPRSVDLCVGYLAELAEVYDNNEVESIVDEPIADDPMDFLANAMNTCSLVDDEHG